MNTWISIILIVVNLFYYNVYPWRNVRTEFEMEGGVYRLDYKVNVETLETMEKGSWEWIPNPDNPA